MSTGTLQGSNLAKARMVTVAGALGAMMAAGLALISADEHAGTAHLPRFSQAIEAPLPEAPAPAPAPAAAPAAANAQPAPGKPVAAASQSAADQPFIIRRILPIKGAIRYGEWHWDEAGVPAGPLVITVDLEARVLSVFRNGYEIGATAVLLGTQEKPTPTGTFPITQKDQHHVSNLYDAPMPYMLRLTNDGVTIHATNVRNGYASHGCIGVPLPFAKKLFGEAHLKDKVYITRGKQVGLGDSLVN